MSKHRITLDVDVDDEGLDDHPDLPNEVDEWDTEELEWALRSGVATAQVSDYTAVKE